MSVNTGYYEFGEISGKAPLEAFYEAMLPLLKNYGLTAQFPADKPSLTQTVSDIEFSVLIGEPPEAIRYIKWQGSPYSSGGIELTLESDALVHKETGEKLSLKIFITDYISGMSHAAGNLWLSVKFSGANSEVEAFKNAVARVLAEYGFRARAAQNSPVSEVEKNNSSANFTDNLKSELMTNNNINFDELARKAFAPGAGESDYEKLFAAAFSLPEWHFIADGNPPNWSPYCALFPDFFGDQPALVVFTDTERARKFMAESDTEFGSKDKPVTIDYGGVSATLSSEDLILSVPTANILDFIEKFIPKGIVKIFFNPNKDSHGFSNDLEIMRPIREHLEGKNLLPKSADKTISEDAPQISAITTLIVQIKDGLGFPSGFVKAAEDMMHLFCRVPHHWVDGEQLKPEYLEKIYARFYGANWRMGNSDGSHYKILDSYTKIFTPETVKTTNFGGTVNQDKHQFFFYIGDNDDSIRKVTAEEFQADIDAETAAENPGQLTELLEENAEIIEDFERENAKPSEKEPDKTTVDSTSDAIDSETSTAPPFDELSRKATETGAMEDLNALFGAVFSLPAWHFIQRGELPGVYPYIASNAQYAGNQPMIRAFTDAKRLQRFARENNLTDPDGSCRILSIPTANIIEYLKGFTGQGAYGVWFNSDTESSGFFIPIKQLQPIKDHLAKLNPPSANAAETEFTTLIATITDGLMLPSGSVSKNSYNCNFFCWVPREWTENLQLKSEYLEKLYEQFYGANWRSGTNTSDGSRRVVLEANSAVISPERVKDTKWNLARNTELNRYWYYIADANGALRNVSADEFQAHFDTYFQAEDKNEAGKQQDNLANFGVSESADGEIELNLNINRIGAVSFETSIAPFYEAIVPLLNDYKGTGDYMSLLRFEESGKSEQVENIAENAHGAYLQIRRFLYLNPKNNVRIGVNSIHSNRLRHVRTNAELIVSFELCKNLDNQTAAFYHAFQGAKSEVLKLTAAIEPILESIGYKAVS